MAMWQETVLTLTVTVLCSVVGVKVSFNTAVYGEEMVNIIGLSLADCIQQCDGLQGCTFVSYVRREFLCRLITGNISTVLNNRKGHVAVDVASGGYLAECKKDCVVDNTNVCPEEKEAEGTAVLGNMNFEGAKRLIRCNAMYALDGLNATACTANGTWSDHGKCVKLSAMREPCQSNTNCIDDDSECRKGRCWCKPGLSHNPVSNSCVAICLGPYGDTFQILDGFAIAGNNRYGIYFDDKMDECMHECLFTDGSDYVCKYLEIHYTSKLCNFNEIPDDEAPQPTPHDGYTLFQRDCAASP